MLSKSPAIAELAHRWGLELGDPLPGATCATLLSASRDGQDLVLKVPEPHAEEAHASHVSLIFADFGGVSILESDAATGSLLMPRLGPDLDAADISEVEKVQVCAALIRRLRSCPSTLAVGSVAKYVGEPTDPRVRRHLDWLDRTPHRRILLHGDLHHANMLRNGDGWSAIDPKGLLGDPAFEIAGYMRNPLREVDCDTLRRRLTTFATELGDALPRLWAWSFVQTAQVAEEPDSSDHWRATAENLWQLRDEFWKEQV